MRRTYLILALAVALALTCSRHTPGPWVPNVHAGASMVASMPNNYGANPSHGHCIDQVQLGMLINEVLQDITDTGGFVESFKVRYSWQGDMFVGGPAVVVVIRKPGGNVHTFVDQTSVNPAIITLEEAESCP